MLEPSERLGPTTVPLLTGNGTRHHDRRNTRETTLWNVGVCCSNMEGFRFSAPRFVCDCRDFEDFVVCWRRFFRGDLRGSVFFRVGDDNLGPVVRLATLEMPGVAEPRAAISALRVTSQDPPAGKTDYRILPPDSREPLLG